MSADHSKKRIALWAWKIMSDPTTSDESYSDAELIYRMTADPSVNGDRPIRIKTTLINTKP